jgi:hypothetical protein
MKAFYRNTSYLYNDSYAFCVSLVFVMWLRNDELCDKRKLPFFDLH